MVKMYNNNSTIAVKCCLYTNFKYQTMPNINHIISILAFSLLYNFSFYQHDFETPWKQLTSYIPCLLNELNCSFMTPKKYTFDIFQYSLISLLHVSASFTQSSGSSMPRFKT